MKKSIRIWVIGLLIVTVFQAYGQAAKAETVEGGNSVLIAENMHSHKQFFLNPGKSFRFRRIESNDFEKGRLISITDSTVIFQKRKMTQTIKYVDLSAIKMPRSKTRKIAGAILALAGPFTLILYSQTGHSATDYQKFYASYLVVSVVTLTAGSSLWEDKIILLNNRNSEWILKAGNR